MDDTPDHRQAPAGAGASLGAGGGYLPGLDTLRAYAALSVVVVHTATNFGDLRSRPSIYPILDRLAMDAQSAVTLFFVLSGFLITLLLLREKGRDGSISIQRFYARRVLRIWPLYYLTAAIGLVLLPWVFGDAYALSGIPAAKIVLVLAMLPNFAGPLGPLGHLWTIGLEEQFYLAWPWVIRRDAVFFAKTAFGIVFIKLMLEAAFTIIDVVGTVELVRGLRFEAMAIGAAGAYFYFVRDPRLRYVYHPFVQGLAGLCMIAIALFDIPLNTYATVGISVIFVIVILNVATNPAVLVKIDHPILDALGRMSYGIYMYHFPILYAVIVMLLRLGVPEGARFDLYLYALTVSGSIGAAAVSFRFFEGPFLRLKDLYSRGSGTRLP